MRNTRVLFIVVLFLLGGAGAFWWWKAQPPAPHGYTGPVDQIRIANIGVYSVFNLLADEEGFFKANGLDAAVTEYDSGATSVGAVENGTADVAVAADFVGAAHLFANPDLRILAEVGNQDTFDLIVRTDEGFATPADLKGKKIGVTKKTAGEYYLGRYLSFAGLGYADVQEVDLNPDDMFAQLKNKQLDAIVTFEPHVYDLTQQLGEQIAVWPIQGNQRALALVYSSRAFIEQHPDVVRRYMLALLEAQQFMDDHPNEARAVLMRRLGFNQAQMTYLATRLDFTIDLNQDVLLTLEDQARWMIATGLTPTAQVPDYLPDIYFDALAQARPDAVTIVH